MATLFKDLIVPYKRLYRYNDRLQSVAKETRTLLDKEIRACNSTKWDDADNKRMHITAYKRMLRALDKFLKDE